VSFDDKPGQTNTGAAERPRQLFITGDGNDVPAALIAAGWRIAHADDAQGVLNALIADLNVNGTLTIAVPPVEEAPSGRRRSGRVSAIPPSRPLLETTPAALLLVGLKRFDAINAAFGRATGDALIVAVERRIETILRNDGGGTVTRIGGTEFAVVPVNAGEPERLALADRIVARLERPFVAGEHFVALGACIGVAEARPGDSAQDAMRRATVALTAARDADVAVRQLSVEDEGLALIGYALETDLRRALDKDEIEVLFQPQVSVIDGTINGVEALARWQHPQHGELGAETLFAVAARSGYLTELSAHVQKRAATKAAAWPQALAALRLSINVTPADIARPAFVETFLRMIDDAGFPRDRLTVEITENGLIEDLDAASTLLAALRAAGCRVAIDDFGTGYSSLAYLKALPLDYLKIDRRLAQDIAGTARDRIVVRGVIDMARSLGLSVIAEGVETDEQLTLLAAEGCQYYQGFLCSVPITGVALIAMISGG
jgi:diguanylate cyclase (GGDEF)-like protein